MALLKKMILFSLLFYTCFPAFQIADAKRAISDDIIARPVLVTLLEGMNGSGSGFYYRDNEKGLFLVSARHVFMIKDRNDNYVIRCKKANLLSYPKDLDWSNPAEFEINLEYLIENDCIQYDKNNDAIVIKLTKETGELKEDGEQVLKLNDWSKKISQGNCLTTIPQHIKKYEEVLVGNEIYISGFPSSLGIQKIPQIDYHKPLLRRGIVAGKNDEQMTIIIDCPSFGGNSGGPVIELDQIDLTKINIRTIGIVTQFVPFVEKWENKQHGLTNLEFQNSGYSIVVPMDVIIKLIDKF